MPGILRNSEASEATARRVAISALAVEADAYLRVLGAEGAREGAVGVAAVVWEAQTPTVRPRRCWGCAKKCVRGSEG